MSHIRVTVLAIQRGSQSKSHGSGNSERESIGNHWAILHPWDTHYQFQILKKSITLKELELEVPSKCVYECSLCVCVFVREYLCMKSFF